MGFSLNAGAAILAVTLLVIIEIFTGALLPSVSDSNEAYLLLKDRLVNQDETMINITSITDVGWWDTDWEYRKMIIIDHDYVTETLTDFPVFINITDNDLKAHAQNDGDDITFVNENNTLQFSHELESYDSKNGTLVAWVNVTKVYANRDTYFFMYYGNATVGSQENPTGTWDGNYMGVWHMKDLIQGITLGDSTNNNNNGIKKDEDEPIEVSGKIMESQNFDGANDYVNCGDDNSLVFGDGSNDYPFTIEAWVNFKDATSNDFLGKLDLTTGSEKKEYLFLTNDKDELMIRTFDNNMNAEYNYSSDDKMKLYEGTWHYYVATYTGTINDFTLYLDGKELSGSVGQGDVEEYVAMEDTDCPFYMGKSIETHGADTNLLDGVMDEVRVSNTARSEAWINTTYHNIHSVSQFLNVEPQQNQDYTYINISVGNAGSENLNISKKTILVNGEQTSFVFLQPFHYPEKCITLLVNVTDTGTKRIKIVSANGRAAYDTFTFP